MLFITEMVTTQTDYVTAFLEPERSQDNKMTAFYSYSPPQPEEDAKCLRKPWQLQKINCQGLGGDYEVAA